MGALGWVLLSFLGLLLFFPVVLAVSYREGNLAVSVRVLFIKLQLLPAKPRKKQHPNETPKAEEEKKPEEEKPKRQRSLEKWVALIKRIANAATAAMRLVLKGFWIYAVELTVPVQAADAAGVALRSGQVQALIGTARAVLANLLHIRYKRLVVYPDFTGAGEESFAFSCRVAVSPAVMLAAGVVGLWKFLFSAAGRPPRKRTAKRAGKQANRQKSLQD